MKRVKNLYQKIYDFETLLFAYNKSGKGRRFSEEVLAYTANFEENLIDTQNHLIHKTYEIGRYRQFFVHDPKKRLIMSLPFRDRVVQWAVYHVLNPVFSKGYIYDSYGCIEEKGSQQAVKRLKYWLNKIGRHKKVYFLKLDISKYFFRVDHAILLDILGRKIADPDTMWLLEKIIKSEDTGFGLPVGFSAHETDERLFDKGMPIGNLTSQMFANIYLNEIDQYCKREMRIRHYIRYMDDIVILSDSKEMLHQYKETISVYLDEKLRLSLNKKTCVRPATLGIDFLGYKVWATHIKLRKSSARKMKRRLKGIQKQYARGEIDFAKANATVQSYLGIMKHCDSLRLKKKIFGEFVLRRNEHEQ